MFPFLLSFSPASHPKDKSSESMKTTSLDFLFSHIFWLLSQSWYHCTTILGMLSQHYIYLLPVMFIGTMFDGEDSVLNGTLMSGVKGFIVSLFVHALT